MGDEEAPVIGSNIPPVTAVSLKLPSFWSKNPVAWFAYIESSFNLQNITRSRTKYDYIVTALPSDVITEITDILANPGADPYDAIKQALLTRTTISERERLRLLLAKEDLGDRKTTQLLRHMQSLLGQDATTFDQKLFRELFLQRLPSSSQRV